MKDFLLKIFRRKRSVFYSFILGLLLLFGLQVLKDYGSKGFLIVILVNCLILIFEIYLNWRYATRSLRQVDLPLGGVYNIWGHILNHLALPILLTLSISGFLFFNNDDLIRIISVLIYVFLILILLINIRSYYEDEFKTESVTRYIYEVIKLVIFFFSINIILHLEELLRLDAWIGTFLICVLIVTLGLLLIYRRNQIGFAQIAYLVLSSIVISVIYIFLDLSNIVLLGVNVIIFILFYFVMSILHNKIERTLTIGILVEYILISILALALFYGLR